MNTFKILAVAVALTFGAVSVNAQKDKTFSFIDAAGNEVADGSSLVFYAAKTEKMPGYPMFGYTIQADFALKVKNNTNSAAEATLHVVAPENPTHGIVQICFPGVCDNHTKGEFTTNSVPMAGNAVNNTGTANVSDIAMTSTFFPIFPIMLTALVNIAIFSDRSSFLLSSTTFEIDVTIPFKLLTACLNIFALIGSVINVVPVEAIVFTMSDMPLNSTDIILVGF